VARGERATRLGHTTDGASCASRGVPPQRRTTPQLARSRHRHRRWQPCCSASCPWVPAYAVPTPAPVVAVPSGISALAGPWVSVPTTVADFPSAELVVVVSVPADGGLLRLETDGRASLALSNGYTSFTGRSAIGFHGSGRRRPPPWQAACSGRRGRRLTPSCRSRWVSTPDRTTPSTAKTATTTRPSHRRASRGRRHVPRRPSRASSTHRIPGFDHQRGRERLHLEARDGRNRVDRRHGLDGLRRTGQRPPRTGSVARPPRSSAPLRAHQLRAHVRRTTSASPSAPPAPSTPWVCG
jgi:hypothetical protein